MTVTEVTRRDPAGPARTGVVLAVLLTGQALASMDTSIVAVAARTIRDDLAAGGAAVQLVLAGYTLAFGVLVVTGARLGDRYGHRRMFRLGLAGFTAASLGCGLAPTAGLLVAGRVVQGAAAALMVPQVLSLIQLSFEGTRRARAVGLYSLVLALGVAAGQILGGLLVWLDLGGASWRPAFLINVPAGVVLLLVAGRVLPAPGARAGRLDLTGVVMLTVAMTAVVLPLALGREQGWPAWSGPVLVAGLLGLAALLIHQRRLAARGGAPLVEPAIFATPAVRGGLLASFLIMGCYAAFLFALTLHLQDGLGFGPLAAGLAFVPYAAGFAAASLALPRLPVGWLRVVPVAGPLVFAVAAGGLAWLAAGGWQPAVTVPLLFAGGAGHAAGFSPLVSRMAELVTPSRAGALSGLVSTGTILAAVLGVAGLGGVYLTVADTGGAGAATGDGFAAVAACLAGLLLLCAVAAYRATRAPGHRRGLVPAEMSNREPPARVGGEIRPREEGGSVIRNDQPEEVRP